MTVFFVMQPQPACEVNELFGSHRTRPCHFFIVMFGLFLLNKR